jgi:hypothetical protein
MRKIVICSGALACAVWAFTCVVACSASDDGAPKDAFDFSNTGRDDGRTRGVDASVPSDAGTRPDAARGVAPNDAGGDAPEGDAGDGDAATETARPYALFVGTDYQRGEFAVFDMEREALEGRAAIDDGDPVAYASGGLGYVLARKSGRAMLLDRNDPTSVARTFDLNDAPDAASWSSNPRAMLLGVGSKAYALRYGSNVIRVVDVASGEARGTIDLSRFVAPGDADGLVEVEAGVFDPATQRAYVLLQRIDVTDFGPAPDYLGKCLATRALIVGIDATRDEVIDINGADEGDAIELEGANPGSLVADFEASRLLVSATGCRVFEGGTLGGRSRRGVEEVRLPSGETSWLYTPDVADTDRLSGVLFVDATRAFVRKGGAWHAWNPAQTALGDAAPWLPAAAVVDRRGRIVAAVSEASESGNTWNVVAMDADGSNRRVLARSIFSAVTPFGVSAALVDTPQASTVR